MGTLAAWLGGAAAAAILLATGCDGDPAAADGGGDAPAIADAAADGGCGVSSLGAIIGGALDDGDPAVVAVNNLLRVQCRRAGLPTCTGALIAPDVVLTAAHCIDPAVPEAVGVLLGPTSEAGAGPLGDGLDGTFFLVTDLAIHPAYDAETLAGDVALLRLDGAPAVEPLALATAPLDDAIVGQTPRVVGYGESDTEPPFRKKQGTVEIIGYDDAEMTYSEATAMTCEGDSGGPVLVTGEDDVERVAAVTSRGDLACAASGAAVRVDTAAVQDLVTAFVNGGVVNGGAP